MGPGSFVGGKYKSTGSDAERDFNLTLTYKPKFEDKRKIVCPPPEKKGKKSNNLEMKSFRIF